MSEDDFEAVTACPLQWPGGWKRSEQQENELAERCP